MNVLIVQRQSLVSGANFSLSVYARIIEAMDWLRDQGQIQYAVCSENDPVILRVLQWAHVVIFCKHISARAQEIALEAKKQGCLTLLDIDDWIFSFPKYSGGTQKHDALRKNIETMFDTVTFVTVANARLRAEIATYRQDVTLVPNGIYTERYPELDFAETYPPRLVFTNADFLKICRFKHDFLRVLQDFSNEYPNAVFDFYGDPFPEICSLPFIHYTNRIHYSDYLTCLAQGGYCFALTPLGGDEDPENLLFNCCKNPFKYLNYGVTGIPCIYSESPIYNECVVDKVTGILAKNTYDDWLRGLELLINDTELRNSIRKAAYDDVCRNYHIRKPAEIFLSLFTR